MKRPHSGFCRILALVLALLLLVGCSAESAFAPEQSAPEPGTAPAQTAFPSAAETGAPVGSVSGQDGGESAETPAASGETTTLLLYMVGSDLESKAGAATGDLQEILGSGVSLDNVNVLVCAGGSTRWQTDRVSETQTSILRLTPEGYTLLTAQPARSMGDAGCLADFVNYAVEAFPAAHYALILWDHGNGPVIGYGKDMLFDNDTLTLHEMQEAMALTPFGDTLRLDWVGFDACLMASAELCCVWAPYADYLLASQEVEPAFGWAYGFLSALDGSEPAALLSEAAAAYLRSCLAYYEKKGYQGRETTLSVLDLSAAAPLAEALDALFAAAGADVAEAYNTLAACRVNTRALGRASTGSEYDLVDLGDLAAQMQADYPAEAEALLAALSDIVLDNRTNAERLCGLSLYYPFYNKPYYTREWAAAYRELGLFPAYQSYLLSYADTWLRNDLLSDCAASEVPVQVRDDRFALRLTEEQAACFASARYYILQKLGEEYYARVFTSENVTLEDGTLYAHYDGKSIYAYDEQTGLFALPAVRELDAVGSCTYYSLPAVLSDAARPEAEKKPNVLANITVCLDAETGELSTVSVKEYEEFDARAGEIAPGKQEDLDPYAYISMCFELEQGRLLTRDENGVIPEYDAWDVDSHITYYYDPLRVREGFSLHYGFPGLDNCVLVFEIQDTQGSRYCSEPLPVERTQADAMPQPERIRMDLTWPEDSDSLELFSTDELTLRICKEEKTDHWDGSVEHSLYLELENRGSEAVGLFTLDPLLYNDNYCASSGPFLYCPPGETVGRKEPDVYDSFRIGKFYFGYAACYEDSEIPVASFDFSFIITRVENKNSMYYPGDIWGVMDPVWGFTDCHLTFETPYPVTAVMSGGKDRVETLRGAAAEPQLVYEDDTLRVSLIDFAPYAYWYSFLGEKPTDGKNARFTVLFENLSDREQTVGILNTVINGYIFSSGTARKSLPPGTKLQCQFTVDTSSFSGLYNKKDEWHVLGVDRIAFTLAHYRSSGSPYTDAVHVCPLTLTAAGSGEVSPPTGTLLLEEFGVRITLLGWNSSSSFAYLLVENNSGADIALDCADVKILGYDPSSDNYLYWSNEEIGAGQTCVAKLYWHLEKGKDPAAEFLSFRPVFLRFHHDKTLYKCRTVLTLYPGDGPQF